MEMREKDKFYRILRNALENQEFEMYLQPKVSPKTAKIGGAEALIRWNNPVYGMLPPDQFLPMLEHSGLIVQVDLYMFRKVCGLLHRWECEGIEPIVISVNVSKADMEYDGILAEYDRIMEETGAPAQYLELEFTEDMSYSDMPRMQRILQWIHEKGARCAMDDFGKAYSNLNVIQELEFDTIKLDKCFFKEDFPNEERGKKIVSGLLEMFQAIGVSVVAEGVETKAQKQELKKMNCELIQGYYYSKPLPVERFEKFWKEREEAVNLLLGTA